MRTSFIECPAPFHLRSRLLCIRNGDVGCDSAPSSPATFKLRAARLRHSQEIIKDAIGDVLVKNTFVAKTLKVELQALQLDAFGIGNVPKNQRSKIWLTCFWADRRKFRTDDFDRIIAVRIGVFEALQRVGEGGTWHLSLPRMVGG